MATYWQHLRLLMILTSLRSVVSGELRSDRSGSGTTHRIKVTTSVQRDVTADNIRQALLGWGSDSNNVRFSEIDTYTRSRGAVKVRQEILVAFETTTPFNKVFDVIRHVIRVSKSHESNNPMIVYVPGENGSHYMRGDFKFNSSADAASKADELVKSGMAACVQVAGCYASIKTTRRRQAVVNSILGPGVRWEIMGGNQSYLAWIAAETAEYPADAASQADAEPQDRGHMFMMSLAVPAVGISGILFVFLRKTCSWAFPRSRRTSSRNCCGWLSQLGTRKLRTESNGKDSSI